MFENKFKLAKDESSELKALLKKLEGNNFEKDILATELELSTLSNDILGHQKGLEDTKLKIDTLTDELKPISEKIKVTPLDITQYFKLHNNLIMSKENLETLKNSNDELNDEHTKLENLIIKLNNYINLVNEKELLKNDAELDKMREQMIPLEKRRQAPRCLGSARRQDRNRRNTTGWYGT